MPDKTVHFAQIAVLIAACYGNAFAQGSLEIPASGATESGIGVISGWHCSATDISIEIDGTSLGRAGSGTQRPDTASVCLNRTDTGFSLLYNWNNLGPGSHVIKVYTNGELFETRTFNSVQSAGSQFATGISKTAQISDFPSTGRNVTLQWNQGKQAFTVTAVSSPTTTTAPTGALSDLYGTVKFNYGFSSTSEYTDRVTFSAANIRTTSTSTLLFGTVSGAGTRDIGCGTAAGTGYMFFCMARYATGQTDNWAFNVGSNWIISGIYEHCSATQTTSSCASDIASTPDGNVVGSVSGTGKAPSSAEDGKLMRPASSSNTPNEADFITWKATDKEISQERSVDETGTAIQQLIDVMHPLRNAQ